MVVGVTHLFELISDSLGLLVPLEPHHVLGVKPPRLLLQSLGGQILSLGALGGAADRVLQRAATVGTWSTRSAVQVHGCYLQVVEDEKQCFCRQSLVEFYGVRVMWRYLMVEGQGGTWIPHQVLSVEEQKRG